MPDAQLTAFNAIEAGKVWLQPRKLHCNTVLAKGGGGWCQCPKLDATCTTSATRTPRKAYLQHIYSDIEFILGLAP